MRKALMICSVFCAMMIGIAAVSAQKGANFAGTWELDKGKSQLPQMMADRLQGATWTITQDDKQISRDQKMNMGEGGGPGGGGGGRGGGMMGGGSLTVKLDGAETVTETQRGKRTVTAKWQNDGKTLEITTINNFGDRSSTSIEHWELTDGGKTLKVHQSRESPNGPIESTLVFTKK